MSCGGGCSNGRRLAGNTGANPSGLLGQGVAAQVENTTLKVSHVDAHTCPKVMPLKNTRMLWDIIKVFSVGMNQPNQLINVTLGGLNLLL